MDRKIILNIAISLDGYIASEDGTFEWIKGDGDHTLDTFNQLSYETFLESIDTVLIGRKAYLDCGVADFDDKSVLVVTSKQMKDHDNIKFISGDIVEYLELLKENQGKDIYLFGGGLVLDPFIKANIIDEYIIGIIPIILGKGRPLFMENNPTIYLHLEEISSIEGIVIFRYTKRTSQ